MTGNKMTPARTAGKPLHGNTQQDPSKPRPTILSEFPYDARNWKNVLQALIRQNNARRAHGDAVVSNQTMHDRANFYFAFFTTLRGLGRFLDPRRVKGTHVELAVATWLGQGLAPATLQKYLSHLRTFATWIGKPGLVRHPDHYIEDAERYKRSYAAKADHGWSSNDIDTDDLIAQVLAFDRYAGLQLLAMRAFGLRPKEACMLRPLSSVVPADQVPEAMRTEGANAAVTHYLHVSRGSKGGRPRYVPIDTPEKQRAVESLRAAVLTPQQHLSDPTKTLQENRRRFRYVLECFGITRSHRGVTAYGLRHGFAHETYERVAGAPAPVQQPDAAVTTDDTQARSQVARQLGHSRTRIAAAYVGAPRRARSTPKTDEVQS